MNPGIAFYENVTVCSVIEPNGLSGGTDYAPFCHVDSLHTFTKAYGRPQVRYACWCGGKVRSTFSVGEVVDEAGRRSRYLLKIVAAWQDWRKQCHPVAILINGKPVYDGPFFLENVLVGWPAQYISLPPHVLKEGENTIEVINNSNGENMLLLSRVEILKRPDLVDFTVHSSPEVVPNGERFWIQLHLLQEYREINVRAPESVQFLERSGECFHFKALREGENVSIVFESGDKHCEAVIDHITPARPERYRPVWLGMDCDDVRHDQTEEMDATLAHFIFSRVGNYVGFRPKPIRNFCDALKPDPRSWRRWVALCKEHGVAMHYSGEHEHLHGFDLIGEAGELFSGYQFHEPYLVFQPYTAVKRNLVTDKLKAARNLLEKKEGYVEYLREQKLKAKKGEALVYSGEPALTCIYSKEAGVDALLCEPVSNISLLYGMARGCRMKFGAHIPADWYFGYPHDEMTLRRLRLAVWLAYAFGGEIIYLESTVFKTNANDRNDWEDPFCVGVRKILRAFHKFTHQDYRIGRPVTPLAFVYGHLESMFWMDDDRISEVVDMGGWDRLHWGFPGETHHRRLWVASEAWLPRVPVEEFRKESLTRMFTGTPYGPVDLISPFADLNPYRAIAFLGWNTMTEEIYHNLLTFVRNGGTVFLCGCHLDTRVDLEASPQMLFDGKVSELIGLEIEGPGFEVLPGIRACALNPKSATRIGEHFWVNTVGKGKVYFGNFYDYPSDFALIAQIKALLSSIGEDVRQAESLQIKTSSPYVHYTIWEHEGRRKIYAVDADWRHDPEKSAAALTLTEGGRSETIPLERNVLTVVTR